MPADLVCAIVVTYHPSVADLRNLYVLASEFLHIVVVDNGSAPESLAALRKAVAETGASLIENGGNLGVATGLNIGLTWAIEHHFNLAVLFDQDSVPVPGFLTAMLAHYNAAPHREKLGILSPVHRDRVHGTWIHPYAGPKGNPITITSGSLLPLDVYQQIGPFLDDLFIDDVDTEYCLRLCRNEFRIEIAAEAQLMHSIGDSTPVTFFGKRLFTMTNHSSVRHYYSVRNRIWIIRNYAGTFPRFSLRLAGAICAELIKVVYGEKAKGAKLTGMARGALDGLRRRGGPYTGAM